MFLILRCQKSKHLGNGDAESSRSTCLFQGRGESPAPLCGRGSPSSPTPPTRRREGQSSHLGELTGVGRA